MSTIQFTVVMPVRNGANYIESTLKGVLGQRYQHFRIIILDNASEDDTLNIIKRLNDPRITVIPSDSPLSIEDNWGRILDLDIDGYMVLLCHDDLLYDHFLDDIVSLILQFPDASLYHTHCRFADVDGKTIRMCWPVPLTETADEYLDRVHHFAEDFLGSGYVMRFSDFKAVGGYPKRYPRLNLADLVCYVSLTRLSYKACSPSVAYDFLRHAQSAGHKSNLDHFVKAAQIYIHDLGETGYLDDSENKLLVYNYLLNTIVRPHYRMALYYSVKSAHDREAHLAECHRLKDMLEAASAKDPLFNVRTGTIRFYEWINSIRPTFIRNLVYYLSKYSLKTLHSFQSLINSMSGADRKSISQLR